MTDSEQPQPEPVIYPKYLSHDDALFVKLCSETKIQCISGQDFGNGNWNWQSSSYECSANLTASMLANPKYKPVNEEVYNTIRNQYIDFHKQLCRVR